MAINTNAPNLQEVIDLLALDFPNHSWALCTRKFVSEKWLFTANICSPNYWDDRAGTMLDRKGWAIVAHGRTPVEALGQALVVALETQDGAASK